MFTFTRSLSVFFFLNTPSLFLFVLCNEPSLYPNVHLFQPIVLSLRTFLLFRSQKSVLYLTATFQCP